MTQYAQLNMRIDATFMEEMRMKAVNLGYPSFTDFVRESMKNNETRSTYANKKVQVSI